MSETTEMSVASLFELVEPTFDLRRAFDLALSPAGRPEDDDDDDDDDNDDDPDDDAGSADDKDDKDDKVSDPDKQRLSREAAKHRNKAKEQRARAEAAEARVRELEDKDNDDDKAKLKRDLDEANEKLNGASTTLGSTLLRAAFAEAQLELGRFKDQDYALYLLGKTEDVEVEDGEVVGMTEWVKDLVENKPDLFVSSGDDEEDDDEEEEDEKSNSGKSSSRKKKKSGLDEQTLKDKFPALANR